MKIAFDTQRLFLNNSGLNNYANLLLNALLNYYGKHEYYTYTPRLTNQLTRFKPGDKLDYFHGTVQNNSVEAFHSGISRLLKCNELNVFHGLNSELPYAAHHLKAKKIVSIHNYNCIYYPERYVCKSEVAYQKKMKKSCEVSDAIVVLNNKAKSCIVEDWHISEKKIVVIPQSCDDVFWDAKKQADDSIFNRYNIPNSFLLYVGDISVYNHLMEVLPVVKQLNIALVVIGKSHPQYIQTVNKYITSNSLTRKVFFPMSVTKKQLAALYNRALCLIHPAEFDEPGSPLVEAMASGCPVITGNDGSLTDACGAAGAYLDVNNTNSYFDIIPQVINNNPLRKQMVKQGLVKVSDYQPEKWVKDFIALYE